MAISPGTAQTSLELISGNQSAPRTGFCSLARSYVWFEKLAFGQGLERARFCLLSNLRDCRDILLMGEGDGRCLAKLAIIAPKARLYYLDSSPAMLERAAARLDAATRARTTFICADALSWAPPFQAYDAVVTAFFLDCFSAETVQRLVAKMQPALRPGAKWLWADFVLPEKGFARWRGYAWLEVMYFFFRWQTKLAVRELPPTEKIFLDAGWQVHAEQDFYGTFTRSVVFSQPGCGS